MFKIGDPSLNFNHPIDLNKLAFEASGRKGIYKSLTPGTSKIGKDYIPPLNAKIQINTKVAPIRSGELRALATPLPEYFNWADPSSSKTKGTFPSDLITPPASQYQCGCCWAVSSTTALADRWAIKAKSSNPNLSYTYLLSCNKNNEQCNGGFPADAGAFFVSDGTVPLSCWDYSWCSANPECSGKSEADPDHLSNDIPKCTSGCISHGGEFKVYKAQAGSVNTLVDIPSIKQEIFENGPVVGSFAVYSDFVLAFTPSFSKADGWAKTKGVYCNNQDVDIYGYNSLDATSEPNSNLLGYHAVTIVGWGIAKGVPSFLNDTDNTDTHTSTKDTENKTVDIPYWIIRNSWGDEWGQAPYDGAEHKGYFKFAMSDTTLGINTKCGMDVPFATDQGSLFGGCVSFLPLVNPSDVKTPDVISVVGNKISNNLIFFVLFIILCIIIYFLYKKHK